VTAAEAPEALLEAWRPMVLAAAVRLLPRAGPVEPEDVASQVIIDLLRVLRTEKTINHPSSYIQKMVMHRVLAETRRVRKLQGGGHSIETQRNVLFEELPDPRAPVPEVGLERRELARKVFETVERLAENRRQVVKLHLRGLPREEIEPLLGFSEAKVRNLLYRGLEDLRELLAKEGIGDATHG
jgi:RNA polymerase sigma-70 factor (ECF subfamily)